MNISLFKQTQPFIILIIWFFATFSLFATDIYFDKDQTKTVTVRFVSTDTGSFVRDLVITDTCGRMKVVRLKASVKVPIAMAGNDKEICFKDTTIIGLPAQGGTPPYTYSWSPALGLNQTNIAQPKASPATTTDYIIVVTDSKGCKGYDTVRITVNPLPTPTISGLNSVCAENTYNYTTPNSANIDNQWSVSGGNIEGSSTGNSINIKWGNGSFGRIKLVQINNLTGCKDSIELNVTINPLPTPKITGNLNVCVGSTDIFEANTGVNLLNNWIVTNGTIVGSSNGNKVEIQWSQPGFGKIKLIQTNSVTGCKDSIEISITINTKPYIELGDDIRICYGDTVQIGNTPSGNAPFEFTWFPNNSLSDYKAEKPRAFPESSQRYLVRVRDKFGCEWIDSITVIVNPKISLNIGRDTTICPGEVLRFRPDLTGGVPPFKSYKWEPAVGINNPNILNPDLVINTPGIYKYKLVVIDDNGCKQTDEIEVKVRNNPTISSNKKDLDFGSLDDCTSEKLDSLEFTNTSSEDIEIYDIVLPIGFSKVSPGLPKKLKSGEKLIIVIKYLPINDGQTQGVMIIKGSPCEWRHELMVKGFKEKMLVSANIGNIDFGRSLTCFDISKDTSITITNTGTSIVNFRINQGLLKNPFTLVEPTTDFSIAPKSDITLKINYKPTTEGLFQEHFELPFTSGTCNSKLSFTLNGEHIEPKMQSSLRNIEFPPLLGCDNVKDTLITIENTGTIDVELVDVFPKSIFKSNKIPIRLSPGEQKQINISFTPNDTGLYEGIMILKYEPCGNTDTIVVKGNKQGIAFSIPNEIDFGELIFCKDKILSKESQIKNISSGGIDGKIEMVIIEGPFSSDLKEGTELINGVPLIFKTNFVPKDDTPLGEISGKITIILSPCNIQKEIILKAVKKDVHFKIIKSLDFGIVAVDEKKTDILKVKNTGTTDVIIDEITGINPPKFLLEKTDPELPVRLQPNQELSIFITYAPESSGQDSIFVNINSKIPCEFSIIEKITGRGTDIFAETIVYIDSLRHQIGAEVYQPLRIRTAKNLLQSGIDSFYTKISFNRTILFPIKGTPMGFIEGNNRIIEFSGKWNNGEWKDTVNGSILKDLYFLSALGNSQCTPMTIEEFLWLGGKSTNKLINGEFCLDTICIEGGARLINPFSKVGIVSIAPNPAKDNIEVDISLTENGVTELILYNTLGLNIMTIFSHPSPELGIIRLSINTSNLATGYYFLQLRTPTYIENRKIIIAK